MAQLSKRPLLAAPVCEPDPIDATGLCLLSLDGGGVRGLSSLFILKRLMDQLNVARQAVDLPTVKPCELFDLIGGTSTGGLIAIMLGRLEMDVDQCITQYNDIIEDVFVERKRRIPIGLAGKIKARFDSEKLKTSIERVLVTNGGTPQDSFNDGKPSGCRTFVCTVAKETMSVTRLRSYSLPDESTIPSTVCQAALATSAATSFFDEVSIGKRKFVDGALGANNPVDEVEGEAANIWCSNSRDLKSVVKCFVSIGTGNPGKQAIKDNLLNFFSSTLIKMKTETEETERKFIARWQKHFDEKRYFRLNVEQGLQNIGLEEYEEQGTIEAVTDDYLRHPAQKLKMRDCVSNLKGKDSRTNTNFAALLHEYSVRKIKQSIETHIAYWSVPFERNPQFVGRSRQLEQMETSLFADDDVSKIALCGLGGIGKSQISLELAYRARKNHPDCSVFWIAATTGERLQQAFLKIGQDLKLPQIEQGQGDARKMVQDYLSQDSIGPWLLIIDNVDDKDIWVNDLKEYLPRRSNGRVALTTRNRFVAVEFAQSNVIEVPEMEEDVATQLLQKSLMKKELTENQQETRELLETLTFLPLAIVQAAAYMNESGCNLQVYKALLAEQEGNVIDVLSKDFDDDGAKYQNAQNPVAITWLISFEQIRRFNPTAAEYLSFMSCVDPKDIPRSLLPPTQSLKTEIDAVGILNAYAFCTWNAANTAVDIHRLVHLATRNWLRRDGQLSFWNEKTKQRLTHVLSEANGKNRSVWRSYLAHAAYLLRSDNADNVAQDTVRLRWFFVNCLYTEGRYNETERSVTDLIRIEEEALGPENSNTLESLNLLGMTCINQGRWGRAEELLVKVTNASSKLLGTDHKFTLSSMANLASLYSHQKRWRKSEEEHLQVLEARRRLMGENNDETATSLANLAQVYSAQGQANKAEGLEKQALRIRIRVLGPEHRNTLNVMHSLALSYYEQGKMNEARDLLERVVESSKKTLGSRHPSTINIISTMAMYHKSQGKWKIAEELNLEALKARREVLGEEHHETVTSMSNLAILYSEQCRWSESTELKKKIADIRARKEGPDSVETLTSLSNLALSYSQQKLWTEAVGLTSQTLEARTRVLGVEHPDTLVSMTNLACAYIGQGLFQKAEELQNKLLDISERVSRDEDLEKLGLISSLAAIYKKQGCLQQSGQLLLKVLEARKRILGMAHESTWKDCNDLASVLRDLGKWKEAEHLDTRVMDMQKQNLGIKHLTTLRTMSAMASIYRSQGRLEEAENLQTQVMDASTEMFEPGHRHILIIMNNLALTYKDRGRYNEAESLQLEVLSAEKRSLGTKDLGTLITMGNLASTYVSQDRLDDAEELQMEVVTIKREVLGGEHESTIDSEGNLAIIYWKRKKYKKAEKLGKEVILKKERMLGTKHPSTLTSQNNLGLVYQEQGQWEQAEQLQRHILEIRKEVFGLKHPDTLDSLGDLAYSRICQSDIEEGIKLMRECYELRVDVLGANHSRTNASLQALNTWTKERDDRRLV